MAIDNLNSLDPNKQNYPEIRPPEDPKYYLSAAEWNKLIQTLKILINDYNANIDNLGESIGLPLITYSDGTTVPTDNNIFSAARTLKEILAVASQYNDTYLSKIHDDTAEGKITFNKGLELGTYEPDFRGGNIDAGANAELNSLKLRQWLEVPELRYNRVEIQMGDKWRSPGGGIIESVDTVNKIATLKLEDGEYGAIAVNDLCMGIFHSMINSNNATSNTDDSKNNRTIKGFATSYFKVEELLNPQENNSRFRYSLRPISTNFTKQVEPEPFMNFAVFGNTTDTDRQSSAYETRTYQRFLINMNTWESTRFNIAAQFGDLTNLNTLGITGVAGYSIYLNSVYLTGTLQQMKSPRIEYGTWWVWDGYQWVDSGVPATGVPKDGLWSSLLNNNVSVVAESNDYDHTWAELHVYEGDKELSYVTSPSMLGAGKYTVTLQPTGVTPGTLTSTSDDNIVTYLWLTPIVGITTTTNAAKIVFKITGKRLDGGDFGFSTGQSFTIVAAGKEGHSPYIGENGNWFVWSEDAQAYIDSGDPAGGDNGRSPYIGGDGYWYAWDDENKEWYNTGVKARGPAGTDGDSVYVEYSVDGTTNWHSTFTSGDRYRREKVGYYGTWNGPMLIVGETGPPGSGVPLVYRGEYREKVNNEYVHYYGSTTRIDIVKYNNVYYRTKETAGDFYGIAPPNSTYWDNFGQSFESVATGLLLSENANIAGFVFRSAVMQSQIGIDSNGNDANLGAMNLILGADPSVIDFIPNLKLDGINGELSVRDKIKFFGNGSGYLANNNLRWDSLGVLSIGPGTTPSIKFNTDGSGYLANGNINWDTNGNVVFLGQTRSPYHNELLTAGSSGYIDASKNNSFYVPTMPNGSNNGWYTTFLPTTQEYNGVTLSFVWNPGNTSLLHWCIKSYPGRIYYEDKDTTLLEFTSDTNRFIQLTAFWNGSLNWIVTKNIRFGAKKEDRVNVGEIFLSGYVDANGAKNSLKCSSKFGFDFTSGKSSTGLYYVNITKSPYNPLNVNNYTAMVTAENGTFPIAAGITSLNTSSIYVYCLREDGLYDSAFRFVLIANEFLDLRMRSSVLT